MIKKVVLFISFSLFHGIYAQSQEIEAVIHGFFEAFHQKDTTLIKTFCHPLLSLHTIVEKKETSQLHYQSKESFFRSLSSIPEGVNFEERLGDITVQVDGDLAHAWMPYRFYNNGAFSHEGVNSFQLFREKLTGSYQWKIISIVDTRRK